MKISSKIARKQSIFDKEKSEIMQNKSDFFYYSQKVKKDCFDNI